MCLGEHEGPQEEEGGEPYLPFHHRYCLRSRLDGVAAEISLTAARCPPDFTLVSIFLQKVRLQISTTQLAIFVGECWFVGLWSPDCDLFM